MKIKNIQVTFPCKEGVVVSTGNGNEKYAIHCGVILAVKKQGNLYLNKDYVMRFTLTNLKVIRGIDETLKRKGEKFVSDWYHIKIVEFVKG